MHCMVVFDQKHTSTPMYKRATHYKIFFLKLKKHTQQKQRRHTLQMKGTYKTHNLHQQINKSPPLQFTIIRFKTKKTCILCANNYRFDSFQKHLYIHVAIQLLSEHGSLLSVTTIRHRKGLQYSQA